MTRRARVRAEPRTPRPQPPAHRVRAGGVDAGDVTHARWRRAALHGRTLSAELGNSTAPRLRPGRDSYDGASGTGARSRTTMVPSSNGAAGAMERAASRWRAEAGVQGVTVPGTLLTQGGLLLVQRSQCRLAVCPFGWLSSAAHTHAPHRRTRATAECSAGCNALRDRTQPAIARIQVTFVFGERDSQSWPR